jgi:hypothetical protein
VHLPGGYAGRLSKLYTVRCTKADNWSVGVVNSCFCRLEEESDDDGISKTFVTLTTLPLASTIGLNSTNLL